MLICSLDPSQLEGSESHLLLTPKSVSRRPWQRQDRLQADAEVLLSTSPAAVTDYAGRRPGASQIIERHYFMPQYNMRAITRGDTALWAKLELRC